MTTSPEIIASPKQFRSRIILLIMASAVMRLCWGATLELGNDEAYHFLYTVHPDWSYFDHPPMLMWVASAGRAICGGWLHPLSLRLGFVLLFAGSTWVLFDWTSRWYGAGAGWYAALALNVAVYYQAAAGTFVLPDGPFLFFALLTMRALSSALFAPTQSIGAWVMVGIVCAFAMTSKYHAVLLPLGTLAFVVLTPRIWPVLGTPGPYVAALLAMLGLIPVLMWNAQHDWASVAFQGSRAVGLQFSARGLLTMVFGPIGYLLPWVWIPAIVELIRRLPKFGSLEGHHRFLICLSLVPLLLFGVVSCMRPILPHWPLIGFIPLLPLVGATWHANSMRQPVLVRRWVAFMLGFTPLLMLAFVMQARFGVLDVNWHRDPALEISGWESVGQELKARGLLDRPNTFLFTDHWYDSGQLAFSVRNAVPVACYNNGDARGFAYWSRPEDWVGKDGIWITAEDDANPSAYVPYFREVEPYATFPMTRGGKPFRTVHVFLCSQQTAPFPFNYRRGQ